MARLHGGNCISRRPIAAAIFVAQLLCMGSGASMLGLGQPAHGDDQRRTVETQRREFAISVDGLKHGSLTMQIRRHSDGTIQVKNDSDLHIHILAYRYAYTSSGNELWKDGRLIAMDNVSDYNGTRYVVKASTTGKSLQVNIDGTVSYLPSDTWLTSYWHTPERLASGELADRTTGDPASAVPQEGRGERYLSILDSDQGRKYRGKLVRVGEETLTVAGDQKPCTHYRITGDVHVELWYDASGRLIRQDSIESRHRVRFELTEIAAE